jgi:hypothetical protein
MKSFAPLLLLLFLSFDAGADDGANWQVYRNSTYRYEIRYPVDFELRPTGPEGERDGATIRIGRKNYAAPRPILDIDVTGGKPDAPVQAADMTAMVDTVDIGGVPAHRRILRWKESGEIAYVVIGIREAKLVFAANGGLKSGLDAPWDAIVGSFRWLP